MPRRKSARLVMRKAAVDTANLGVRSTRSSLRKKADSTLKPSARGKKTRARPKSPISSEPDISDTKANQKKGRSSRSKPKSKKSSSRGAKGSESELADKDELQDSAPEWEVEEIVDSKKEGHTTLYFVKWAGYPENENTWEPETNLHNSRQAIRSFEAKRWANENYPVTPLGKLGLEKGAGSR
ncbi:uncharacterized protein BP5553_03125 [Venustampulla echinocandica]|uniref:Chromo domain-containing protein n=1 Tax=Venustampulla echinocandica TaxID=2656787 RepID=A0A370TTD5_9HELO|nr:uncharacterized protein BP5553_03125 [Venustampulla echinocandica]RDL38785.1 hypothetical protein BP5553_03125 [Venustampulla echinocandica]